MNRIVAVLASAATFAGAACSGNPAPGEGPSYRVRADFAAPLDADRGWAGGLDENVTVEADRPFRLRLEVERAAAASGTERFRLEYRRNRGPWQEVEAHDFPYPLRELELDFADAAEGSLAEGWRAAAGNDAGIVVSADRDEAFLRARADDAPLVGLYPPPWQLDAFSLAAEYRLPADGGIAGLVFGYVDAGNHWRLVADAREGGLRVSRLAGGVETVVAERAAGVVPGEWLITEVQHEAGRLEITFGDDALEFGVPVGDAVPGSDLGFFVPAGGRADFRRFVIEGEPSTPRVSIVSTDAYRHGDATGDLLRGSSAPVAAGAGISLAPRTPPVAVAGGHAEFEWPLVIRKFADGAAMNEAGDTFEFRVTGEDGASAGPRRNPALELEVPPGHLGGTFVETPGRIGPWQAANGDLYFIMEPAESDNLFMMLRSTDGGESWREADGANRPATGDLESVDGRQVGDTIHILHQVTESTRYHAFRTSDHPTRPDSWVVTDELATTVTARSQMASLVVRPDGSMVAFHLGSTIGYALRSPSGEWGEEIIVEDASAAHLAGPQAVLGRDAVVHLAYYRSDGTLWYRRLEPDGTLTPPRQLAGGAGTTEDDFGAVLPLVYLPDTDTVVVVYRLADGRLWERRITGDGAPTAAVAVTDRRVARHTVDSQQAGADAVADGGIVRVLFIDEADRGIYSTSDDGGWRPPVLEVGGIEGSWVRGNVYARPDGTKVYGYVYDAGSRGGAGMNRFAEVVPSPRWDQVHRDQVQLARRARR